MQAMVAGQDVLNQADEAVLESQAVRLVHAVYGLDGTAERLAGERDQNYRFTARTGERYLLKLSHPAEAPEITNLQTRILLHVARSDPSLPTPRIRPTLNGEPEHVWRRPDGRSSTIRLLTFLPGRPLHAVNGGALEALGEALARLDRALEGFSHPAEDHHLLWDLQHASRLRPLLPAITDAAQRELADAALRRFEDRAAPRLGALRQQVIHNDLNPHNVLVASEPFAVTGLLDFGDSVRAPLVQDLAVAAAYQLDSEGPPLNRMHRMARGYHAVLPLTPEEIELLPILILGRLAMTAVITAWRAERHPENRSYILRNAPAAWRGLERLAAADLDGAAAGIRAALEDDRP